MSEAGDDRFEVRPGRIRSRGSGRRAKTFLSRMARSMSAAGPPRGRYGAGRFSQVRSVGQRRVVVKARIVRMSASSVGALRAHLGYIRRDSAALDQEKGRLFNDISDDAPTRDFVENAEKDRHHFRFIVSPEDGAELADLKPFARDLVSQMETDLGTRLDWVAAVHDDTAHPHAHIVVRGKRDDGRDLVMPRAYISHTIRNRAEGLVTLELGPETVLEAKQKIAREASAERLTRIDRFLIRQAGEAGELKLGKSPSEWRSVHAARLKTLERLGLAEKTGRAVWKLADALEAILTGLGERRDIAKAMNRALAGLEGRRFDPDAILKSVDPNGRKVTGAVLAKGVSGEGHDQAYVILDGLDGRAVYGGIGDPSQLEDMDIGSVVSLRPPDTSPKPADRTVAEIAARHQGIYSAGLHQSSDPKAGPEFIAAHVRRLEALRRAGLVRRESDGSWHIPDDHLSKVEAWQRRRAGRAPLSMTIESRSPLSAQQSAIGATWLDHAPAYEASHVGWGGEVRDALNNRIAFLKEIGLTVPANGKLSEKQLGKLEQMDLDAAGKEVSHSLGKTYRRAPNAGRIEGVYKQHLDRPSGRFAVIERQNDFTIVPWRKVLERNRGKSVTGQISKGQISWTLTKGRGIGR